MNREPDARSGTPEPHLPEVVFSLTAVPFFHSLTNVDVEAPLDRTS